MDKIGTVEPTLEDFSEKKKRVRNPLVPIGIYFPYFSSFTFLLLFLFIYLFLSFCIWNGFYLIYLGFGHLVNGFFLKKYIFDIHKITPICFLFLVLDLSNNLCLTS